MLQKRKINSKEQETPKSRKFFKNSNGQKVEDDENGSSNWIYQTVKMQFIDHQKML